MECLIKQDKIGLADIMIKSRDIKREFDKLKEVKDVKNFLFTRWINEMKKESLDDNSIHQNNSIEQKGKILNQLFLNSLKYINNLNHHKQ